MVHPKKRSLRELAELVASLGPDDGVPSKILKKSEGPSPGHLDKSARRLARAAERQLTLSLQEARGDPVMAYLAIAQVEPGGDGAHLRVRVVPCDPANPPPAERVRMALLQATGWLRSELARAVRRRRVPQLVFDYAPCAEEEP